jgi:quercetin dioxygenase-like cupin family protein
MNIKPLLVKNEEVELRQFGEGCICKILLDRHTGIKNIGMGTVTIEPGQRTEEHTRSVEEVIFAYQGETHVVTEDAEYKISQGDCIYIPAGVKHYHENKSNETIEQLFVFSPQGPEKEMRKLKIIPKSV